ncbi:MAG TPA: transporter [Jatrophihabitantaceae bacterium]|nr:transporter [Jatrophihabitantaceae bacterium]
MTRLLLVIGCLVLFALVLLGLRLGWRHRAQRQSGLPALTPAPVELGAARLAPMTGLYVGTAYARSWQDRVVAGGLGRRAAATATLHAAGLLIERDGDESLFIAATDVVDAGLAAGLAGKVVGAGGLLVVRWRLGADELDTGMRADDKTAYPDWVRALTAAATPNQAAQNQPAVLDQPINERDGAEL